MEQNATWGSGVLLKIPSGCWNTSWEGVHLRSPRQNPELEPRGGRASRAAQLTTAARMEKPDAVVWRDPGLPLTEQGLTVLGAPIGQVEFVQAQ